MNTLSKLALVAAAAVFAASASAQTVYDASVDTQDTQSTVSPRIVPASQQAVNSNWVSNAGEQVWMTNGGTRCVRSTGWTSDTANKGCDGAIVEKPIALTPPPVDTAPIAPPIASEKVTYQTEVRFDFNNTRIKSTEQVKLDEIYAKIKGLDSLEIIVVTGYTDEIGSSAYNMTLSSRRADEVKRYLISKGIESTRVYTEGKGKSNPVVTDCKEQIAGQADAKVTKKHTRNRMIICLSPNRRVEIQVVGTVQDAQPQGVMNDIQPQSAPQTEPVQSVY